MPASQTVAQDARARDTRISALEQELSEFTYIVSHDLAAPFRHLRAFSELLRQDAGTGFTPEQNAYCTQIEAASEKCTVMLEQLLVLSRIMRKPLEIMECDFASLLDTARLQLGEQVRRSGGEIVGGGKARLRVDRELFTQALRHVLDNALKFRRDGVAPRVEVALTADAAATRIRITDNGIGPPVMDHERLFGMFYRGHPDTAYPGSGTGLTIARRILRRHGGDVRFCDQPDGACVEIQLPNPSEER